MKYRKISDPQTDLAFALTCSHLSYKTYHSICNSLYLLWMILITIDMAFNSQMSLSVHQLLFPFLYHLLVIWMYVTYKSDYAIQSRKNVFFIFYVILLAMMLTFIYIRVSSVMILLIMFYFSFSIFAWKEIFSLTMTDCSFTYMFDNNRIFDKYVVFHVSNGNCHTYLRSLFYALVNLNGLGFECTDKHSKAYLDIVDSLLDLDHISWLLNGSVKCNILYEIESLHASQFCNRFLTIWWHQCNLDALRVCFGKWICCYSCLLSVSVCVFYISFGLSFYILLRDACVLFVYTLLLYALRGAIYFEMKYRHCWIDPFLKYKQVMCVTNKCLNQMDGYHSLSYLHDLLWRQCVQLLLPKLLPLPMPITNLVLDYCGIHNDYSNKQNQDLLRKMKYSTKSTDNYVPIPALRLANLVNVINNNHWP